MTSMVRTKYSSQVNAIPQKRYKISGHHSHRFEFFTSVSASLTSASASETPESAEPVVALASADKNSEAVATSAVNGTETARLTMNTSKGSVASFAETKAHLGQLLPASRNCGPRCRRKTEGVSSSSGAENGDPPGNI